jgi:ESS family glutamate:Na+ symporter
MFGGILPVGFEGGHGTAGGMGPVFDDYNWAAGKDLAVASATVGIVSAIVVGMILINWAARRGYTVRRMSPANVPEDESIGVIPVGRRPEAGKMTVSSDAIGALTLHVAMVGLAIGLGFAAKLVLVEIGALVGTGTDFFKVMKAFPLFPLAMLGGIAVNLGANRFHAPQIIDPGLTRRIQNLALDFLVVAAIATIRIQAIAEAWVPFLILMVAGIAWNVLCVLVLARRMLPDAWFERSIAEMGQSMGVTATGLLLLRVVDPDYESPAAEAFASKQLMHEPFMGGGLWTGAAIPLLATIGPLPVFLIACGAVLFWVLLILLPKVLGAKAAGGGGK